MKRLNGTGRDRVEYVNDAALDEGGLIKQWLNDYMSKLRTHSLTFDHLGMNSKTSNGNGKSLNYKTFYCKCLAVDIYLFLIYITNFYLSIYLSIRF
jgi:hypothetical protein